MWKNLFKKKKTQEEIDEIIIGKINSIKSDYSVGRRDFSKLKELDDEILLNDSIDVAQSDLFLEVIEKVEDKLLYLEYDIQEVLDMLKDMTTLTFEPCAFQARKFLKHKELFERKLERTYSVLSTKEDIKTQLEDIKINSSEYKEALKKFNSCMSTAYAAYQKRESYGVEQLSERLSIVSNFMLCKMTKEEIALAKKGILAMALTGDLEFYESYIVMVYERYFSVRKDGLRTIPCVDVLISEAIIRAYGYKIPRLRDSELEDVDLQKNIDLFVKEHGQYLEMREQLMLLNRVYECLGLDVRVPELKSDIGYTFDDRKLCMFCDNRFVDKEKDEYICKIHNCYVDSETSCEHFKKQEIDMEAIKAFL